MGITDVNLVVKIVEMFGGTMPNLERVMTKDEAIEFLSGYIAPNASISGVRLGSNRVRVLVPVLEAEKHPAQLVADDITSVVASALELKRRKDGSVTVNCGYSPIIYVADALSECLGRKIKYVEL